MLDALEATCTTSGFMCWITTMYSKLNLSGLIWNYPEARCSYKIGDADDVEQSCKARLTACTGMSKPLFLRSGLACLLTFSVLS